MEDLQTTPASGVTDAPATPDDSGAAPAAGETVNATAEAAATETVDTSNVDVGTEDTAPEHSSPEQVSRWGRLRDRAKSAETERDTLREQVAGYASIEPVREHVLGIAEGLTASEVNPVAVLEHMLAIDPVGTNHTAAYLIERFTPDAYGATPDEIRQALATVRTGAPAQVQQPATTAASQAFIPPSELALARPDLAAALTEELTFLDGAEGQGPALGEYVRSLIAENARLRAGEATRSEAEATARAAAERATIEAAKAEYAEQFSPIVRDEFAAWGVTDPVIAAELWLLVEASIEAARMDREILEEAGNLYAANRKLPAQQKAPAVEAVLRRHIGVVLNRHRGPRQQQQVAASEAARQRTAPQTPTHVPGSAAPPASQHKESLHDRLQRIYAGQQ